MFPDLTRRDFLSLCSVLASSLAACSSVTHRTRIASSFVVDPALGDYREALRAVIRTILPVDSPDFGLDLPFVEQRFLRMFPLEDERQFLSLQRTLVYFDQLDLAPHIAAPLLAAERVALDVPERISASEFRRLCDRKIEADSRACDAFFERFGPATHFSALGPDARLAWMRLWRVSELSVKRQFANTLRATICVTAYSADRLWPAIGYDGPLVGTPERGA